MKRILIIGMLVFLMVMSSCTQTPNNPTQPIDTEPTLPNETPYMDVSQFHHSFGFSSLEVTNRQDKGYLITEVDDEVEFLDALLDVNTKVIQINNDLSMGSLEVSQRLIDHGKTLSQYSNVYRAHSRQPLMHPTLKLSGVGQIRLVGREDLMIFSINGIKISHASILIDESSNLVFRNLHMSELWEWDEYSRGQYKRNDWDYFTIEASHGIWFDHITFDQAYDGIIDVKEHSSNLTLSWSILNFRPNAFVQTQIEDLEANIQDRPYYQELREEGISQEDLVTFASFQKKGFNLGNTTDGEGFESITMTFHHLKIYNLMDRMPRLRKGDVHLYHLFLDNEELYNLRLKLTSPLLSFVNQGIVSTEGGSVLMEHSIFKYVSTPIKNHQESDTDTKYTGSYRVINSELRLANRLYFGSTDDKNSLWIHTGLVPAIDYQMRNHEEIPYPYTLQDVYYLEETLSTYLVGVGSIPHVDWTIINPS